MVLKPAINSSIKRQCICGHEYLGGQFNCTDYGAPLMAASASPASAVMFV
jgi:hypothetical protein